MCGIVGIKLFNNLPSATDEDMILNALKRQVHRGPDNSKAISTGFSVLGHNRLSIIDTAERSHQPFTDGSGRYSLVFNGEIYNFHELKHDLLTKGYTFRTSSDTEVLFYLLIDKKVEALQDLKGCFSFAFYDKTEDYMLLARDRMGINPLLYSIQENRLLFGSELFVFNELGISRTISDEALNYYFQYTYIPAPYTIYREVFKLPPSHYLEVKGSTIKLDSYWTPENKIPFSGNYEQAKIKLREKVELGIISQLEADVPVGTFLSGGVDSSIVSAIASTVKNDLHTFSVSFGDQKKYDESEYALKVAKHIQSEHHVIRLTESDFKYSFQEILNSFDEPFADSSSIAMWFLARETSKYLKVALSGDGADELFAGYNKHLAFRKAANLPKSKQFIFRQAENALVPLLKRGHTKKAHKLQKFNTLSTLTWPHNYWYLASNIGEKEKNKLLKVTLSCPYLFEREYHSLNDFLLIDQQFVLVNDMLKKVDLMSMNHSMEVRTPFMDEDLVKFANSLPEEYKLKGSTGKFILKETFSEILPDEIFSRKKQGFEVPLNAWIKKSWNDLIPESWFDKNFIEEQNIFNFEAVIDLKRQFLSNLGTANQEIWAYIVFQNWYQKIHQHG